MPPPCLAAPVTLVRPEGAQLKDRILLLITGIVCAFLAWLSFQLPDGVTRYINYATAALGVYLLLRKCKQWARNRRK